MNAIEPIADAVTGGLAARTVEPATGVDGSGHTTERACLNCGTALVGDYCHACGQHAHVHRSLGAFGHDLLHGVFHFEGKIWRTLPMLAWRPGELTRRYIDGQRASFVSPIALFLFGVFLMFAVVSQLPSSAFVDTSQMQAGLEKGARESEARLRELEAERTTAVATGDQAAVQTIDRKIASQNEDLALTRDIAAKGAAGALAHASDDTPFSIASLNEAYAKAVKNPELLFFKLKSNGYKYSWALIPLSLPLMWLLFPFSRRWRLYDHTVFVTYSLCFMTLLVVAGSLYKLAGLPGVGLLMFVPPVHMYRQLRGAYSLSRLSALWRAAVMSVGSFSIVLLFGIALVLLGLFD
ncbi:DUF3667 domain-containing protein [Sphingomonas glaciei]|uniref:DUF3667 domain-containing protein n=1 Tax=Sphingomonas glaciei TaxID=2938948 RepID=A0ABY5MWD6_9SPHN|nr:DUF3667 domain-containing protein [Sphingomonas glaciei]UUR07652.1 DUF3667 domain-containing protein [Sphingomonas glaciei]